VVRTVWSMLESEYIKRAVVRIDLVKINNVYINQDLSSFLQPEPMFHKPNTNTHRQIHGRLTMCVTNY